MFACAERGRLLGEWRHAVMILGDRIGQTETSNLDRFDERYKATMRAREIAETAHTTLVRHRKKHSC